MIENYEKFAERMEKTYSKMFSGPYGGFEISAGWWPVIESLCKNIQDHIDWVNDTRDSLIKDNPYNHVIPDVIPQVEVQQIKEKFGGLRFYYRGGDEAIAGMVRMAEAWAGHSCEVCGAIGKSRGGGWVRTLCDLHYKEQEEKRKSIDNNFVYHVK